MSTHQGKTLTPVVVHVDKPIKDRVGGIESAHEVGDHVILGKPRPDTDILDKVGSFLSEKFEEFGKAIHSQLYALQSDLSFLRLRCSPNLAP